MRVVLEQGVPRDAAARLRGLGYECVHVGELGMCRPADDEIVAWSLEQDAILVSLDADFHTILAVSGAGKPSVIRLRMQGLGAQKVVEMVRNVLVKYGDDLNRGSLVTVKPRKITCHRLPVGSSD
jgi:predicted nuclease of predicted toxin-antitoxin system